LEAACSGRSRAQPPAREGEPTRGGQAYPFLRCADEFFQVGEAPSILGWGLTGWVVIGLGRPERKMRRGRSSSAAERTPLYYSMPGPITDTARPMRKEPCVLPDCACASATFFPV
jgi:hypothetical protein